MGTADSKLILDDLDTIYRSEYEKCCCATRYYRMSQSTRRDQWSGFTLGALHAHNRLRQNHGAQPMSLNLRLCKMAYSQARYLADNEIFEHSEKEERRHAEGYCGENLAESVLWHDEYRRPSGEEVSLIWYDEGKNYDFKKTGFDPDCAQFTQLIWKGTKFFGIAFAEYEPTETKGFVKTVIVANYYPGGNIEGRFAENVLEPIQKEVINNSYRSTKVQRKIDLYRKKKRRRTKKTNYVNGNLG